MRLSSEKRTFETGSENNCLRLVGTQYRCALCQTRDHQLKDNINDATEIVRPLRCLDE